MAFLMFLVIIAGADSVPSGYKIVNFGNLALMSPKPTFHYSILFSVFASTKVSK